MAIRRTCALLVAAALTVEALSIVAGAAASAAPVTLDVGTVADQLVTTDGRLFLAGSKGVDVGADLAAARTTVTGIPEASALAEAPDETVVYAAGAEGLFAITGLTATPVDTGAHGCLEDVAVTTAAVWVVSTCDAATPDVPTGPVVVSVVGNQVTGDVFPIAEPGAVRLASTPGRPDFLVVADHAKQSYTDWNGEKHEYVAPRFRTFDTSTTNNTELGQFAYGYDGEVPVLALNADGSRLLAGTPSSVALFDALTAPKYLGNVIGQAAAAAFSPDGRFFAVTDPDGRRATVFRSVDVQAVRYVVVTPQSTARTVSWSATSLAVTTHSSTGDYLQVTADGGRARVTLNLSAQYERFVWGDAVTVSGSLVTDPGTGARGARLTVTRRGPDGTRSLGQVVATENGSITVRDRPPAAGRYTYGFARTADADYAAVSGSVTRLVERRDNRLTITTDRKTYQAQQRAIVTIRLGHWYSNRTVSLYGEGYRERRVLIKSGAVGSNGILRVPVYLPFTVRLTATYGGDAHYASAGAFLDRSVRARLITSTTKRLKKRGTYSVFRAGKTMGLAANVTPFGKKDKVTFTVQQGHGKKWRSWGEGYAPIAKDGWSVIGFKGKRGERYRFRASVYDSAYANGATSAWRYVTFR